MRRSKAKGSLYRFLRWQQVTWHAQCLTPDASPATALVNRTRNGVMCTIEGGGGRDACAPGRGYALKTKYWPDIVCICSVLRRVLVLILSRYSTVQYLYSMYGTIVLYCIVRLQRFTGVMIVAMKALRTDINRQPCIPHQGSWDH